TGHDPHCRGGGGHGPRGETGRGAGPWHQGAVGQDQSVARAGQGGCPLLDAGSRSRRRRCRGATAGHRRSGAWRYRAGGARRQPCQGSPVRARRERATVALVTHVTMPAGTPLYRARINPPDREYQAWPISQMGQPPANSAPDGRVNPAGIPCFYAAFELVTAIAEKRPWALANVSVATFTTIRPHKV